ncbi:MAG: nicotinate phosphoribosyltransferase [Deltaproteobacteria bacterium]|nr:nicotinate phosphoribosyltransferase [Deltaproteobacteria bacterium]
MSGQLSRDGIDDVYGGSLALLTDLYQLSMACGYWKAGTSEREAAFHLTFRRPPFDGGYAIAAGIAPALAFLRRLRFTADDVGFLATIPDASGSPLFPPAFLDYLGDLRFTCTVDAIPEGSVVFAHEPIIRVIGPILQAQIVETALLTLVNFQTLIATKASRVVASARGAAVVEFGLRRAQGIDGGLSASRAAYLGGTAGTSSVLAGKLFGIPVKGTHAHSWVMAHGDELAAFRAYADALPGNTTFLVDTYDTLQGVRNAITVGHELRARGHQLAGIRLDSGDLAHLSIEARRMLDADGFGDAKITASNDLDEHLINSLHDQGARIDVWGIGTKLVTAFDQPALGGVYKLGATRQDGTWRAVLKLSEQPIKISNPGILQVKRLRLGGALVGDILYDREAGFSGPTLHDIEDPLRAPVSPTFDSAEDLLVTYLERGEPVRDLDSLEVCRARAASDLAALSPRTRRFANPQPHPVGLDRHVHTQKLRLIAAARGLSHA